MRVDRDAIEPEHFRAGSTGRNRSGSASISTRRSSRIRKPPTASRCRIQDKGIRKFWIEHGRVSRIGAAIRPRARDPMRHELWIPDGFKDTPVDRKAPRERLIESLDAIFAEADSTRKLESATPSKASCSASAPRVTTSDPMSSISVMPSRAKTALPRRRTLSPDGNHRRQDFVGADAFLDEILLHVSRGVRWDSDHVSC